MEHFTPLSALLGGALIGLSASAMLHFNGRVTGITGIISGLIRPREGEVGWRAAFVAGLLVGGAMLAVAMPAQFNSLPHQAPGVVVFAGLLVGFGTRMGNGCTSGHGVCGIPRGSTRSIVATVVFMATGAAAVYVVRHLLGGAL